MAKPALPSRESNPETHSTLHSPVFSCSNLRTRSASSGKRDTHPYCSLNRANGLAGVPQTVCPRRIVFPDGTPACAPIIASSSNVQCGAMPTCPPISTCAPMVQLPEIPTCAATTEFLPIRTLCATCTRLSIFTPLAICVASSDPRSIVVLQPISTSSLISTLPICGNLRCRPSPYTYPKPPSPAFPSRAPAYSVTRGCSRQSCPTRAPRPRKQNASTAVPVPISTS